MKNICPFCAEMHDNTLNPLKQNRIVRETENFIVIPSVGCLVVNYLLVIPKNHYTCFGQLNKMEYNELYALLEDLHSINQTIFKSKTIMFEHGSVTENSNSGNSVYHAHLHVLPFINTLMDDILSDDLKVNQISDIHDLRATIEKTSSYLYYYDIDKKSYDITHAGIVSQYFRRLISKHLNKPDEWNWRKYPFIENMSKTLSLHREIYMYS